MEWEVVEWEEWVVWVAWVNPAWAAVWVAFNNPLLIQDHFLKNMLRSLPK